MKLKDILEQYAGERYEDRDKAMKKAIQQIHQYIKALSKGKVIKIGGKNV